MFGPLMAIGVRNDEVNARKAVGWDYHGRFLLAAFEFEGNSLILERAARTLRMRIDASQIDRSTVPMYMKGIVTALKELHSMRLVHMDVTGFSME